jgi:hypothetical protein
LTGSRRRTPGGIPLAAALLLATLLGASCAPTRPLLGAAERDEAWRFFRGRWAAASFPARGSFSGTAALPSGTWPLLVGVEALAPDRETAGLFTPFGQEVALVRNDGEKLSFEAGPFAGPMAALDRKRLPLPGFSLGRLFSGAPAFEPVEGECSRGEEGEWLCEGKGQTLRSDPERRFLASARYRVAGEEFSVSYPGWDGSAVPASLAISGRGTTVAVRRDPEGGE